MHNNRKRRVRERGMVAGLLMDEKSRTCLNLLLATPPSRAEVTESGFSKARRICASAGHSGKMYERNDSVMYEYKVVYPIPFMAKMLKKFTFKIKKKNSLQ